MTNKSLKRLITLMLPIFLMLTTTLSIGCTEKESIPQNQTEASNLPPGWVTPQQAFKLIQMNKNNPNFVILNDLPKSQFDQGHIPGSIDIPYGTFFVGELDKLDKNKTYLVYCGEGCGAISKYMKQLGFTKVYEIEGGLRAWVAAKLPLEQ